MLVFNTMPSEGRMLTLRGWPTYPCSDQDSHPPSTLLNKNTTIYNSGNMLSVN